MRASPESASLRFSLSMSLIQLAFRPSRASRIMPVAGRGRKGSPWRSNGILVREIDDLATEVIEAAGHVKQLSERRLHRRLALGRHEEHEEPAAARAQELAAHRARFHARLVHVVDDRRRDLGGQPALKYPLLVQHLAEVEQAVLLA